MITYQQLALSCGFASTDAAPKAASKYKTKPTCLEDLTECFSEGMSQREKKEAIMKWWRCGDRTARKYMAQYGLTEKKFERSDYKELHEHLDEISEQISDEAEEIHGHIAEVKEQLNVSTDSIHEHLTLNSNSLHEHLNAVCALIKEQAEESKKQHEEIKANTDADFEKWLKQQTTHSTYY